MKFNLKGTIIGGVLGGIAALVVGFVFNFVWSAIFPKYMSLMSELGGLRPYEDPLMTVFIFGQPFVFALAMAIAYNWMKPACVCGKEGKCNRMCRGAIYGALVWFVAQVPAAFTIYTSMDYPLLVVAGWLIGPLFTYPIAGMIIAKFAE
ncbi:MAG: hypothetical protein V1676_04075 [Candidatus Diapherotrites archaeon]